MLPPAPPSALSTPHTKTARTDRGDSHPPSAPDMKIRYRAEIDSGRITAVLDPGTFDFHVDAQPDYSPSRMASLLDRIYGMGYEPMSEDECGAEILPSGGVRIYFVPVGV